MAEKGAQSSATRRSLKGHTTTVAGIGPTGRKPETELAMNFGVHPHLPTGSVKHIRDSNCNRTFTKQWATRLGVMARALVAALGCGEDL